MPFDAVLGSCTVTCGEDLNCPIAEYTAKAINNFYFLEVLISYMFQLRGVPSEEPLPANQNSPRNSHEPITAPKLMNECSRL